jgi:hypothetical protein
VTNYEQGTWFTKVGCISWRCRKFHKRTISQCLERRAGCTFNLAYVLRVESLSDFTNYKMLRRDNDVWWNVSEQHVTKTFMWWRSIRISSKIQTFNIPQMEWTGSKLHTSRTQLTLERMRFYVKISQAMTQKIYPWLVWESTLFLSCLGQLE